MTALLGALVFLGRAVLILALVLLAAAALLLVMPVGIVFRWTPAEGAAVQACAGPVRRRLYPLRSSQSHKGEAARPVKSGESGNAPAPKDKKADEPAVPAHLAAEPRPEPLPEQGTGTPPPAEAADRGPDTVPPPAEKDAVLEAGKALLRTLYPHRARLLRGVEVRDATVFWTVTGDDAADTAVAYGRWMALANNLLGLARQVLTIRADSLRIEPDFTGQLAEKRIFSCQIRTRPYIILLVLFYLTRRDEQGRIPLKLILDQLGTLA